MMLRNPLAGHSLLCAHAPKTFSAAVIALLALPLLFQPVMAQQIDTDAYITDTIATDSPMTTTGGMGGVSVDALGIVYMSNFGERVWRIRPLSGETEVLADRLMMASGNTVLANGDLLQAEFMADRIRRISRDGEISVFSEAGMSGPVGMTTGPDGRIYVANCRAGNIVVVPAEGGAATPFASHEQFNCPNGITLGGDGNLYVVNNPDTPVFRVTPEGEVSVLAHLPGVGNGHIAFAGGALYVTQLWNHKIVRVDLDGSFRTVAGTGRPGHADGPDGTSTITHPNGIAARGGSVYFNTIRGAMGAGVEPAELELRRIRIPGPMQVLVRAFDEGGIAAMGQAYRAYRDGGTDPGALGGGIEDATYTLFQRDQYEAGVALSALYLADNGEDVGALRDHGDAERFYGDIDKAREVYQWALALAPGDVEIEKRIEDLDDPVMP